MGLGCFCSPRCHQYAVLDHAFYDDKALSLLLLEAGGNSGRPALVLLPISSAAEADGLSTFTNISLNSPRERLNIDQLW